MPRRAVWRCVRVMLASVWLAGFAGAAEALVRGDGPPAISPSEVSRASYAGGKLPRGQSALAARIQILLDRAGSSPGVIDGRFGENFRKAIRGFERMRGLPVDGRMDKAVWRQLMRGAGPAPVRHVISEADLDRIVAPLPKDYASLAERDWLGFTSAAEALAERFHMDTDFLRLLNPGADFAVPGTQIWVADTGQDSHARVARIEIHRALAQASAYAADGAVVATYPVAIGSRETPSPHGTHKVTTVASEPSYTYRPTGAAAQGDVTGTLVLPPGPNSPVGIAWIGLSAPSYGIHGTDEPADIDKSTSRGCVRMVNWDAMELAHMVSPGVTVEFVE